MAMLTREVSIAPRRPPFYQVATGLDLQALHANGAVIFSCSETPSNHGPLFQTL
jgi:hypothetical protein